MLRFENLPVWGWWALALWFPLLLLVLGIAWRQRTRLVGRLANPVLIQALSQSISPARRVWKRDPAHPGCALPAVRGCRSEVLQ